MRTQLLKPFLFFCAMTFVFQNCTSQKTTETAAPSAVAQDEFASASTSQSQLKLFDFIAYSSEGIVAQSSDYLGLIGSAGDITFLSFLAQRDSSLQCLDAPHNECNIYSRTRIDFTNGSVSTLINGEVKDACMEAPEVIATRVVHGGTRSQVTVDYDALTAEMREISRRLGHELAQEFGSENVSDNNFVAKKRVNIFNVKAEDLSRELRVTFTGNAEQIFVINVRGKKVTFVDKGIYRNGSLKPSRILWNFLDAEEISIHDSGADGSAFGYQVGIPGTFLAPYALVSFHRAAITGALFAAYINGSGHDNTRASAPLESNIFNPAGQLNKDCFQGGELGVGCADGPVVCDTRPSKSCVAVTDAQGGKYKTTAKSERACLDICQDKGPWTFDQRKDWNVCWYNKGFVYEGSTTAQVCVATINHEGATSQTRRETARECLDYCGGFGDFTHENRQKWNLCWFSDKFVFEH